MDNVKVEAKHYEQAIESAKRLNSGMSDPHKEYVADAIAWIEKRARELAKQENQ